VSEVFHVDRDPRIVLPGYHNIITRCRNEDGRGGVGLFIKDSINFKVREDLSVFIPHVYESLFVEVENESHKKIIAGVIYRPNTLPSADVDVFTSTLFDIMEIINTDGKSSLILGDVNICLLKYGTNDKTRDYVDGILSRGFLPVIHKPTRVTHTSATLIDHIYSNLTCKDTLSGIILTDVADHFGTFYIVNDSNRNTDKPTFITKRKFTKTNMTKFKQLLCDRDFSEIINYDCPNSAYDKFMSIYKTIFNETFPLLKTRFNKKYMKRDPWVSTGLLASARHKAKLFKKKLSKPTDENIKCYKNYLNLFNKAKRELKRNYYSHLLELNKNNMKNTWSVLKQAIGKQNDKSNWPQTFKIDNKYISGETEITNSFNKYFSKIGKTTSENVPKTYKKVNDYLKTPQINSIFLETIEPDQVLEITNKLKPKLSTGHDEISSKLLQESIEYIKYPLTHIINRSIITGIVPNQLKIAKVIPIHKSADPTELKNYRPISLLPAFSKIFERIMYNKVMSFLNSNNILYKHQYGFREKHSTIHPIIHLLNQCAIANNSTPKQVTLSIFCDLSKAFDVIKTDTLLNKLNYYGIRGVANKWFASYLVNRKQYVQIGKTKSDIEFMNCGVPQGSILGPLLYLIYVNDISKSTNAHILSFADDTSLIISDTDISTLYQRANVEMNNLFEWFCANGLSLNKNKTKYMVFKGGTKNLDFNILDISVGGTHLEQIGSQFQEKTTKFLGVFLDETLSWKYHLIYVKNKISRALYGIKQVKKFLPKNSLKTLYLALIQPYISYGLLIWGNANSSILQKTVSLQKRAIRIINNAGYNNHTDPLFKNCEILKLSDMYQYHVCLFMDDFINKRLPISFDGLFRLNSEVQENRVTRQSSHMHVPRCNSALSSKLPLVNFPIIWNNWNSILSTCNSRSKTKKTLKSYILATYSASVKCNNPYCCQCTHV
jgi:hypothetical protein